MHREGQEVHLDPKEARAGGRGSTVLKILVLSLVMIVALYGAMLWFGIASAPYVPEPSATDVAQ